MKTSAARKKERKKESQEVETQAQTVLTLGLDQITEFVYRLDEPLVVGDVLYSDSISA